MDVLKRLISAVKLNVSNVPVSQVWIGLHWTAVTSSLGTGLAATNGDAPCCHSKDVDWVGNLHKHTAFELVDLLFSLHPLDVSIGMAALNSLIRIDPQDGVELNARDLMMQRCRNKKAAIIGHFPFAGMLKKTASAVWVLELEPGPDEYPAAAATQLLPQADVIGLTATTLMNGTFESLYPLFPKDALVVMIGPSTPMHPILFDYGIDILAGAQVVAAQDVYRYVGQGSTPHHVEGIRRITLAKQPF